MISMVTHLEWTIRLLTVALADTRNLNAVRDLDELERSKVVHSPFWPNDLSPEADLNTVLKALVIEYNRFLANFHP